MEGAPKIPEENIERPDSLKNKIKKWGKIAAITSLGFMPMKDTFAGNYGGKEDPKIEREEKIKLLMNDIKSTGTKQEAGKAKEIMEEAYKKYDAQKAWLEGVIGSEAYKERMMKELGSNEKAADMYINHRKENLNDKDYELVYGNEVENNVIGQYGHDDKLVKLVTNPPKGREASGVHELTHDITDAGVTMTEKSKELYSKSFNYELVKGQLTRSEISYLENPTERDARKKVLEYDLEKLGVKKYGEEFTIEHYKKAVKLMKEGKLSDNSVEFIVTTRPEYFLKIMNEIAENKIAKDDNQNLA